MKTITRENRRWLEWSVWPGVSMLILMSFLSGCTHSDHYAPVGYAGTLSGSHYRVQPGDTLYSIAFRFGLDYKSVAKANGIKPPFTIFANQKIRIAGIPPDNIPDSKPDEVRPGSGPQQAVKSVPSPVRPSAPKPANNKKLRWIWPLKGKVVKTFSLSGNINKGVDIGGRAGQLVVSAAGGVVVYAGGGLRGYGKLVIVKHNDRFLSAYGNNDRLLVKEGQNVRAGDKLAKIGGTVQRKHFLHFEIRRDGKPQNPLGYLPRSKVASGV